MNAQFLVERLRYGGSRLGAVGIAGLLLLVAALLYAPLVAGPARQRQASMAAQIQASQAELSRLEGLAIAGKDVPPARQLQGYYASFPSVDSAPKMLSSVFNAAGKASLLLESGEYSWSRIDKDPLIRYKLAFPVKGRFPAILRFVDGVLRTVPAAALDSVSFKRQKSEDEVLEAKVVFVLYLKAES